MKKNICSFRCSYCICSIILSVFLTIGNKITFSGSVSASYTLNYFEAFHFTDLIYFLFWNLAIYFILVIMNLTINKYGSIMFTANTNISLNVHCWAFYSCALILLWLPWLLTLAPGSVLTDSLSSIHQSLGAPLNNQHPILYTAFVSIFIHIGIALDNINIGIFLYTICQYTAMALSLGYVLAWLYKHNIKSLIIIVVLLYYAFTPYFPSYAVIMWKDPLFSTFLLLYSLLFINIAEANTTYRSRQGIIAYFLLSLGIMFFRNNGIFIVLACGIVLFLCFGKRLKVYYICWASAMLIYALVTGPVYKYLDVKKPAMEAMGIPLQQIAYIVTHSGIIDSDHEQFIYQLLPKEEFLTNYAPCLVDPLKWNASFNVEFLENNAKDFLSVWLQLFPSNISSYIKSYCLGTYGFWYPGIQNNYGYIDTYIADNNLGIYRHDIVEQLTGYSLYSLIEKLKLYIGSGSLAWFMLVSLTLVVSSRNKRYIAFYCPGLFCWGSVLLATPVAFSLRYVYILPMALPLFIFVPFIIAHSPQTHSVFN